MVEGREAVLATRVDCRTAVEKCKDFFEQPPNRSHLEGAVSKVPHLVDVAQRKADELWQLLFAIPLQHFVDRHVSLSATQALRWPPCPSNTGLAYPDRRPASDLASDWVAPSLMSHQAAHELDHKPTSLGPTD